MLSGSAVAFVLGASFGVLVSGQGEIRNHPEYAVNTGASWVRLNVNIDGSDPSYTPFLAAGLNVVLTLVHRDATNIDTAYGTLQQWPNAGFPYRSRATYEQRVRDALVAAIPYLGSGRSVYVQCENEAGDVLANADSTYWRGTTDQYMSQLSAFYEAVGGVDSRLRVVLTSFASNSLEILIDPSDPRYQAATARFSRMLSEGAYDYADLHFYNCTSSIASKAKWVNARLPAGRGWISTENGGPDSECAATPLAYLQNPPLFEQTEAQQVPLRLAGCADAGGTVCLWFSLFDLRGESERFAHLGLLDQSSMPPRQKPAYAAFQTFIQRQAPPLRRRAARH